MNETTERTELQTLVRDYAELDRHPKSDPVFRVSAVTGLGLSIVYSARAIPALGISICLLCAGILASKGVSAHYSGDRSKWGEFILLSSLLIALSVLGFGDVLSAKLASRESNHEPVIEVIAQ
jgi:hypothetical protein